MISKEHISVVKRSNNRVPRDMLPPAQRSKVTNGRRL
jgi:hypothetical protein